MSIEDFPSTVPCVEAEEGDYYDHRGYLICGKCNTCREFDVEWLGKLRKVPVLCKCREHARDYEAKLNKQIKRLERFEKIKKAGITDRQYEDYTFDIDDMANEKISRVCRNYVKKWPDMTNNNMGILFYGTVGTGKSFFACCIANELMKQLVPACITNFPRILNNLQGFGDERQAFIDQLQRFDLLVIDDLGVERDTSYIAEQIYNVVDTRMRANKPTIITTNLTLSEMENTKDMQYKRIYDRILEMCPIRLKMDGVSRRSENAKRKREEALKLLL